MVIRNNWIFMCSLNVVFRVPCRHNHQPPYPMKCVYWQECLCVFSVYNMLRMILQARVHTCMFLLFLFTVFVCWCRWYLISALQLSLGIIIFRCIKTPACLRLSACQLTEDPQHMLYSKTKSKVWISFPQTCGSRCDSSSAGTVRAGTHSQSGLLYLMETADWNTKACFFLSQSLPETVAQLCLWGTLACSEVCLLGLWYMTYLS